jgi:phosphopantothenoylcysteine decarboxylase/phosphopantothenate--cysteine ligase
MSASKLLFIVTGSIAAYKACDAISRLVQRGHRVRVVATPSALKFVGPATFEGLTGTPVSSDLFAAGEALEHIDLTRWADAVVVCPATANTLNRFAAGLADDLAGALFLARDRTKPWLIAPAMNPAMWSHPATRASVEKLQSWGVRLIHPGAGRTACGEHGEGRLAEPAELVSAIETVLVKPTKRLRVLVTAGGTQEPIDEVRVLTNTSTGATGAGIATQLARRGHEVTLLRARGAKPSEGGCHEETFVTFADLDAALTRLLGEGKFDAVIHAAAVGDFTVDRTHSEQKLDSSSSHELRLRPTPKLIDTLRARSSAPLQVVAFKLTSSASETESVEAVRALFAHAHPDLIVFNDLAHRGASADDFPAEIYHPDLTIAARCATRRELAERIEPLLVDGASAP